MDGIRILPNWWASTCSLRSGDDSLIDVDGRIRPPVWKDLQRLLDAASSRSLLVDLTFTRETVTDNGAQRRVLSHLAYEAALVQLIGSRDYFKGRYRNMLVDVQNEWTRFATAGEIDRLLRRLREADPDRVLAASVSGDGYVPAGRQLPNMVAAYHDPRGRDWFTDRPARQSARPRPRPATCLPAGRCRQHGLWSTCGPRPGPAPSRPRPRARRAAAWTSTREPLTSASRWKLAEPAGMGARRSEQLSANKLRRVGSFPVRVHKNSPASTDRSVLSHFSVRRV